MKTLILAGLVVAGLCVGQQPEEGNRQRFYRLHYVVKEFESDKVINSRAYDTTAGLTDRDMSSVRAGTRVPYVSVSKDGSRNTQYYDIGVNIDSRAARELTGGQFGLMVEAEISSLIAPKNAAGPEEPPVVRRTNWRAPIVVDLKKPTTIFSSDDPTGNRKMQLELTVTPIN